MDNWLGCYGGEPHLKEPLYSDIVVKQRIHTGRLMKGKQGFSRVMRSNLHGVFSGILG